MNDEQRLEELREIRERERVDRARKLQLIREVFPENRGEPKVRGRLNEVAEATGWKREYVSRVRDGKVTE